MIVSMWFNVETQTENNAKRFFSHNALQGRMILLSVQFGAVKHTSFHLQHLNDLFDIRLHEKLADFGNFTACK